MKRHRTPQQIIEHARRLANAYGPRAGTIHEFTGQEQRGLYLGMMELLRDIATSDVDKLSLSRLCNTTLSSELGTPREEADPARHQFLRDWMETQKDA